MIFQVYLNFSVVLKLRGRPLSPNQKEKFRRKKAISILLAVTLIFSVTWAPLNIFTFLKVALGYPNHNIIFGLMRLLGGTNSIANPILYGYMNENFKKEYKTFYRKIFGIPKFRTMKNVGSRFLRLAFYKKSLTSQNDETLEMKEMEKPTNLRIRTLENPHQYPEGQEAIPIQSRGAKPRGIGLELFLGPEG